MTYLLKIGFYMATGFDPFATLFVQEEQPGIEHILIIFIIGVRDRQCQCF
jgi:hypothetical protein